MKDVAEATFNAIISQSRIQFVIPIWQRLYSWEQEHWEDLWEDLMYQYEKLQKGEAVVHFLGPIVVKTVEEKVGQITRRMLIDGQQRMTTLLLICALIRDIARTEGKSNLADEVESHLLFNEYAKEIEDRFKLCPTEADRKVFNMIINGDSVGAVLDGSQLAYAQDFFKDKLESFKDKYNIEVLLDCLRALKMVTIRLEEGDNPNRIFETLNFRGKELAQSDLVRNHFMMAIRDENKANQIYSDIWFPMQQSLGFGTLERIENMEIFLRHYMVMINHNVVKKDKVYTEIRNRIKYSSEDEVISELKSISNYSKYYGRLLYTSREEELDVRRGIDRLNKLRVGVHYPLLLKVYNGVNNGKISTDDFCFVLRIIESFLVRRIFQRLPTNSLNRLFADLCKLSEEDIVDSLQNELASKKSWMTQYWPTDDDFKEKLRTVPIYSISSWRCRFVLETLEEEFKHPEKVELSNLWIEHVMPETLDEEWKNYLGEDWGSIHSTYVHTIGNLTLIAPSPNESISNKQFLEKHILLYLTR